jgi:hypothetical protein
MVDSMSHFWNADGGILSMVDKAGASSNGKFGAWREASPLQDAMINAILGYNGHTIVTMRSKAAYAM